MAIHQAVAYVLHSIEGRHQQQACCLKTLAGEAGLSATRLARLIKRQTGVGFHEHLRRRRVTTAQHLLRSSPLALKAIAAAAGFGTASQFTRQFKHSVGATPSGFRAAGADLPGEGAARSIATDDRARAHRQEKESVPACQPALQP